MVRRSGIENAGTLFSGDSKIRQAHSQKRGKHLTLAETIGDRQAICESRLIAAEAHLLTGELEECSRELQRVSAETTDSPTDLAFTGEAHRLNGMLNMARNDAASAAQHFGSSVSIFDMLGDRYRAARAHLELGRAYATILPERAGEHLSRALNTFQGIGRAARFVAR